MQHMTEEEARKLYSKQVADMICTRITDTWEYKMLHEEIVKFGEVCQHILKCKKLKN